MSSTLTRRRRVERGRPIPAGRRSSSRSSTWGLHTVRNRFRRFAGSYVVGPAGDAIRLTIDAASVDTDAGPCSLSDDAAHARAQASGWCLARQGR